MQREKIRPSSSQQGQELFDELTYKAMTDIERIREDTRIARRDALRQAEEFRNEARITAQNEAKVEAEQIKAEARNKANCEAQ